MWTVLRRKDDEGGKFMTGRRRSATKTKRMKGRKRKTEVQRGSFLTCSTHWITRRRGEDLRCKIFKGHHFSVVLNNGLQIESSLFIAGLDSLKENDRRESNKAAEPYTCTFKQIR